jgi:YVTN family beta-propeller protein
LKKFFRVIVFLLLLFGCKSSTGPTTPEAVFVDTGDNPRDVGVNPTTNKIYVANWGSDNVTVIDGETNGTVTVAVGDYPQAI